MTPRIRRPVLERGDRGPLLALVVCAVALIGSAVLAPDADAHEGCPALIVETFGDTAADACAVAWCESRWVPTARGELGERGLYQFLYGTWLSTSVGGATGWEAAYDPDTNIAAAYELSAGGTDWSHWSCRYATEGHAHD